MKSFTVPSLYRSSLITAIKQRRKQEDKMKKDFSPTLLDLGPLQLYIARHFGFCYGVENAIEISFKTIEENPGKRIYLLSEMIHNPQVNADLIEKGAQFLQDTRGNQLIPFESLNPDDVVIIPAFGTTLAIESQLKKRGIPTEKFNTTCPFVEKVWNRSDQIASKGYSIVIHGKPQHEETRATFSHAASFAPSVVVKDLQETVRLARYITGQGKPEEFYSEFAGRFSDGFDPARDLQRVGVVNQTTQLATDTQEIADYLKQLYTSHYRLTEQNINERFADNRDTLCYATNDNQSAVQGLLEQPADLAIVVGGYNSSNTTHLVELCEEKLPTYFINAETSIVSNKDILHFNFHEKHEVLTTGYIPEKKPVKILLTSGASCPDAVVEKVIRRLAGFFDVEDKVDGITERFLKQ
jgi:4-hydroxy-3-methylbut-2-enyl diphosphate reductase